MDYLVNNVVPWGPELLSEKAIGVHVDVTQLALDSPGDDMPLSQEPRIEPVAEEAAAPIIREQKEKSRLSFFDLPLEIRLQIYNWVHMASPVRQAPLAPWYPTPTHSAYFLQAVMPGLEVGASTGPPSTPHVVRKTGASAADRDLPGHPRLLSPFRPMSRVPTAFLRTCRRLYEEARAVPFHENEFVFVNWFSSGLSTGRAFTRGLRPWQRESIRYVRMEVQGIDLTGDRAQDWKETCEFWAEGLRGLRLKIAVDGRVFIPHFGVGYLEDRGQLDPRVLVEETHGWIDDGLKRLRNLTHLEVELADSQWTSEQKVDWARRLSEMVNEGRRAGAEVSVLCVERAVKAPQWECKDLDDASG